MKLEQLNKDIHVLTKSQLGTIFGGQLSGEGTFIKSKTPKYVPMPDGSTKTVIVIVWRDYSSDDKEGGCYDWAGDWRTSEYDA